MTLIEQLQAEHRVLMHALHEIRASIDPETGRLPNGTAVFTLTLVQDMLLGHLTREDEKLYPLLRGAAATDPEIAELLRRFDDEMIGITAATKGFFDKYSAGGRGLFTSQFPSDLEALYKLVQNRILAEELELYPAFEQAEASGATPLAPVPAPAPQVLVPIPARSNGFAWLVAACGVVMMAVVWSFVVH